MKKHAQVVVIGGGVIGCSILYHLTKLGWSDVILLERDELTSGSTWHAAAGIHGLHDSTNISRIQHYTMKLYKELESETGQGCGIFQPGSLYLAQTENRSHQLHLQAAKAKLYGMNFYEISRSEAEKLHPLVNFDGIQTIMWEPDGGNVDPSGVTAAYAAGARNKGANIYRFTPVTATIQQKDGSWVVETPNGEIHTQWIVNAAGLWGREVAKLAGFELPLMPTEHQYFVTETIAEIKKMDRRLPSIADRDAEYYLRQEGKGLLVGAYERDVRFWAEKKTPLGFGHELLDDDLERIEANITRAIERVPILNEAGIKRVINGPMIWSPDSNVLFGPVPELKNYFCCNGIIPGFSQSGGMGLLAAEWIIEGETKYDMFAWDIARFDTWADKEFTKSRVADQYTKRYSIHFPNEERSAGRPVRTRPVYEMQNKLGAVMGLSFGWEHPLWFANEPGVKDSTGFTRQNWWLPVGKECKMLRNNAGIIDISNFAKYVVRGKKAYEWLDKVFANKIPTEVGRSTLAPLISSRGGLAGDFTINLIEENEYWIFGSGMAERYHKRIFYSVPFPEGVIFESMTDNICGFSVSGPKSRKILQHLTNTSLNTKDFPFMRSKRIELAGIQVHALRISFTGDLGWEIHCNTFDQKKLYSALLDTGKEFGARPVGSRALMSMRIEKGYGSWSREYSPEYWPHEQGMARFCNMDKNFLNKAALENVLRKTPREEMYLLHLDESSVRESNADATGGEPIFKDGIGIGRVTSGTYGYTVGMSLALAMIKNVRPGDDVYVMVLGKPHKAKILHEPPFDPKGEKLRA
ncbi:MAG: dehydrogenase [Rhodobacteraceae bacterium]|nr:MAG: dehydrogenase [Paracoccaceae bacterium]